MNIYVRVLLSITIVLTIFFISAVIGTTLKMTNANLGMFCLVVSNIASLMLGYGFIAKRIR